jgi:hypothetical protein
LLVGTYAVWSSGLWEGRTMGREAVCTCDWAGTVAEVEALLESSELILRGDIRRHVPFSEIKNVRVQADCLCFTVGREAVQLVLGDSAAAKWAATITRPPPSLARKLGITDKTVVRAIGVVGADELKTALAEAARIADKHADLIVACVDTPAALRAALKQARSALLQGVPIWMVYAKGPGRALNETVIRGFLRENGLMDTKVASVSSELTALRFNLRKAD